MNAGKSKVIVFGEDGDVPIQGAGLEHCNRSKILRVWRMKADVANIESNIR